MTPVVIKLNPDTNYLSPGPPMEAIPFKNSDWVESELKDAPYLRQFFRVKFTSSQGCRTKTKKQLIGKCQTTTDWKSYYWFEL